LAILQFNVKETPMRHLLLSLALITLATAAQAQFMPE
jgi:hypothetical protein